MSYHIYDTELKMWVKKNFKDHLSAGITMCDLRSDSFRAENKNEAEQALRLVTDLWIDHKRAKEIIGDLTIVEFT